jgi:hypothetical protein
LFDGRGLSVSAPSVAEIHAVLESARAVVTRAGSEDLARLSETIVCRVPGAGYGCRIRLRRCWPGRRHVTARRLIGTA